LLHDHDADDLRTEKYRGYDFSDLTNRMKSPSDIKRSKPSGNAKYSNFLITDITVINGWSNLYKSHRFHKDLMEKTCAYCGKTFLGEGWPHVEGDSNRGVTKIEQFCSEEHKYNFLTSRS
jgi:hypothetical protein